MLNRKKAKPKYIDETGNNSIIKESHPLVYVQVKVEKNMIKTTNPPTTLYFWYRRLKKHSL